MPLVLCGRTNLQGKSYIVSLFHDTEHCQPGKVLFAIEEESDVRWLPSLNPARSSSHCVTMPKAPSRTPICSCHSKRSISSLLIRLIK